MAVKRGSQIDEGLHTTPNPRTGDLLSPCISPAMQSIKATIRDIASTEIPVLITGETGTGKEIVAIALHQLSHRSSGPLVKIRCASLKRDEFYSRLGMAGTAGGLPASSTVFFDEIADISPECQALLLESFARQDGGPEKFLLGGGVVSTTGRNMEAAMHAGGFRRDLYYRLSGVSITLPPLRQRREDVIPLAAFFAAKYAALYGRPCPEFNPVMAQRLNEHSWPGNVRELENTVKRIVALGSYSAALSELGEGNNGSPARSNGPEGHSLKEAARAASRQAEKELILKALSRTRWNRKKAAEQLQISYKALLYKLKQIDFDEPVA